MNTLDEVRTAISEQGLTWEAGTTPIGQEFARGNFKRFGFSRKKTEPGGGRGGLTQQGFAFQGGGPPKQLDWRNVKGENWTTAVRDQGSCGSCVGFATTAVLESRRKILREDPHFGDELSVAHLFFCGAGPSGCDDGWLIGHSLARCRNNGVGSERDFRYKPTQQKCKDISPVIRVPRWRKANRPEERKKAIVTRGPVIAGMVVYADFGWYRAGVYRPTTAEQLGLHAIAVIGYDDAAGCWLAKNSWGTAWGEGGFFRIGYGCCGVDSEFAFYDIAVEEVAVEEVA